MPRPVFLLALAVIAAAVALAPAAQAINKCVGADGRVSYSDAPCEGAARNTVLTPNSAGPGSGGAAAGASDGDKLKALQAARREKDIEYELEQIDSDISVYRHNMDQDIERVRHRKKGAANNLAGATYEQSISTEMQAIVASYDAKIKLKQSQAEVLRSELNALRARK